MDLDVCRLLSYLYSRPLVLYNSFLEFPIAFHRVTCSSPHTTVRKRHQPGQIRSGMGAYAGAARRCVHLTTVLLRPPVWQSPRQTPGPPCPYTSELHLTQPWSMWTPSRHGPAPRISTRKNPVGGKPYASMGTCPTTPLWAHAHKGVVAGDQPP